MLNRFFGNNFHSKFHIAGISLLAIGLPSSKILLSLSSMLLILNLLLEASFRAYWENVKTNRTFHFLLVFILFHIVSLFWSSDMHYAAADLRIKLTLLVIPLVLAAKPITRKSISWILGFFVATLFVTSVANFIVYLGANGSQNHLDIRQLSLFGSHIRYGILIAIGSGISIFYMYTSRSSYKFALIFPCAWFIFYTYFSQVLSGFMATIVVLICFFVWIAFQRSKLLGISVLLTSVGIPSILLGVFLMRNENKSIQPGLLEKTTQKGNAYSHYFGESTFVNGKPVLAYVCEKELEEEWTKRSSLLYNGEDLNRQPLRYTLMRYMTSKDLKKDAAGMEKMSDADIRNVEKGIASIEESRSGIVVRLEGIKWQLYNSADPNGHSLLQRLAYWKTGWSIIQKNWLLGVGTGDLQLAFDQQYVLEHSPLRAENRLRAHNSYLTAWISFGIFGFLAFIWMNIYFLTENLKSFNYLGIMFILVAMTTFLIEDTLETQMGVSFYALFFGLFSQRTLASALRLSPSV